MKIFHRSAFSLSPFWGQISNHLENLPLSLGSTPNPYPNVGDVSRPHWRDNGHPFTIAVGALDLDGKHGWYWNSTMDIHWKEIVSPQAGLTAVFWDLCILGALGALWEGVRRWWKGRPDAFRRKLILWVATLACFLGLVYCLGQMLWAFSGHISDELANSLRGHPKLWCEDMGWSLGEVDPTSHLLSFNIRVYNAGSPTVLRDWQLMVKGPNQAPFHAFFVQNQSATQPRIIKGTNAEAHAIFPACARDFFGWRPRRPRNFLS